MPILRHSLSFDGFGLVPFQINPHYLDASTKPSGFVGHSRAQRIIEFLQENDVPVLALREGSWIIVGNASVCL